MVRQDELPWQGRSTVLLDLRKAAHTDETLEAAVSAAATIANACWRRRDLVRLVTTTGLDTGFGAAAAHIESVMEHLATADVSSFGSLKNVVEALHQAGGGGALFATVGAAPAADVEALLRLRRRFGSVNVVIFGRSAEAPTSAADGLSQHTRVVHVNHGESFARTWNKAASERRAIRRASLDRGTERHGVNV
jgi:hypothetical protein